MQERLTEIDVFRGLAVIIMIIVDAPPDFNVIYPILTHSHWQGVTIADLAFPFFVFSMGMSAAMSKNAFRLERVLNRVVILFAIGLMFNMFPVMLNHLMYGYDITNVRILGVLQRLALTYALGLILCRMLKTNAKIIYIAFLILLATSAGFRIYNPISPFDELNNLSRAVDVFVLGEAHIYQNTFEPEGIYGTINSSVTMMLGFVCGGILKNKSKMYRLQMFGLMMLITGLIWSQFDIISKPLWTAPFVLITCGIGFVIMSLLTDLCKNHTVLNIFKPVRVVGMNPLLFYLMTNFALITLWTIQVEGVPMYIWLWLNTTCNFINPSFGAAAFAVIWCALWLPLAEYFYRKRIIFKL